MRLLSQNELKDKRQEIEDGISKRQMELTRKEEDFKKLKDNLLNSVDNFNQEKKDWLEEISVKRKELNLWGIRLEEKEIVLKLKEREFKDKVNNLIKSI